METDAQARQHFQALLTGEPQRTAPLKRALRALQDQQDQPRVVMALALLNGILRKTTPLHVRLIHAAAQMVLGSPSAPEPTHDAILLEVARTARRHDLL